MEKNQSQSPITSPAASLVNLGKREQVKRANQNIFLWVAASSVIIVICVVAATFLVRQAIFNQKIINQKSKTNQTVEQNVENVKLMKGKVDALLADSNLAVLKVSPTDNNLKVVIDALPTTEDSTALSNSIYTKIFGTSGVATESISVGDPTAASASIVPTASVVAAAPTGAAPQPVTMQFQGSVNGSDAAVANMFRNFERTIRPMNLTKLIIKAGGSGSLTVSLNGETYYVANDTVSLGKVPIKP